MGGSEISQPRPLTASDTSASVVHTVEGRSTATPVDDYVLSPGEMTALLFGRLTPCVCHDKEGRAAPSVRYRIALDRLTQMP